MFIDQILGLIDLILVLIDVNLYPLDLLTIGGGRSLPLPFKF